MFPRPGDPRPDPVHPLAMVLCGECSLAQLEWDPTSPDEPRGVEPAALVDQAAEAIRTIGRAGLLPDGGRVLEHPSPHGGSWIPQLAAGGLDPVTAGPADVVVDSFGMMHEADQRTALRRRTDELADNGTLFLQFHSLAAIVRTGMWNALRHGHFAYYSTPVLIRMAQECGLQAVDAWQYDLYGGTVMLALRRTGEPSKQVRSLVQDEVACGVLDSRRVADLQRAMTCSAEAIRSFVHRHRVAGRRVFGYSAASRAVALLAAAGVTADEIMGIADASPAKEGRCLPGRRIPVITPAALIAAHPDRVLLFVPDLAAEVRRQFPEIESHGGRWVVLEPQPREHEPVPVSVS
jgi:hypothetical protein